MSSIVPFQFDQSTVRTFTAENGEPVFIAADVLTVLDLDRKALERLDDDEKGVSLIHTLGGEQQMTTINESGLYSLVLGCRKPESKRFKKWVTSEVLPAIRKTGAYAVATLSPAEMLVAQAQLYLEHERELQRLEQEQRAIKAQLSAMVNGEDYFTVVGFANLHRIKLDATAAKRLGRKATAICHANNWPVGEAKHPLYGLVGTYPIDALTEAFNG